MIGESSIHNYVVKCLHPDRPLQCVRQHTHRLDAHAYSYSYQVCMWYYNSATVLTIFVVLF